MTKEAILSPTDPQIIIENETYSIKSIIDMCETKEKNFISDKYLLNYYENKKLHYENILMVTDILKNKFKKNISNDKKKELIDVITSGNKSHHNPLSGLYLNKYIDIYLTMPQNITDIYIIYEDIFVYL
jgi:hypothetical protein